MLPFETSIDTYRFLYELRGVEEDKTFANQIGHRNAYLY